MAVSDLNPIVIDGHIDYLRNEMEDLAHKYGRARWAANKIGRLAWIVKTLEEARRVQQMTGMNGKPIE